MWLEVRQEHVQLGTEKVYISPLLVGCDKRHLRIELHLRGGARKMRTRTNGSHAVTENVQGLDFGLALAWGRPRRLRTGAIHVQCMSCVRCRLPLPFQISFAIYHILTDRLLSYTRYTAKPYYVCIYHHCQTLTCIVTLCIELLLFSSDSGWCHLIDFAYVGTYR
ncbi:hypothetical protein GQ55_4G004800 [Panicum hallii var. hallii]|uniref:Uncharacterized protein n=1 Tax=Panicum hallii var. hallii TaxID=1504633 RepID=A0A2T7DTS5_9POAL|nr:hypothetical protein GQ55_4G004800 [Panicum hallii var. hallii]